MPLVSRRPIAALLLMMGVAASAQTSIDWHQYYEHAREEAQRTGKPIFIAFRCGP